jgi:hypothetical protein
MQVSVNTMKATPFSIPALNVAGLNAHTHGRHHWYDFNAARGTHTVSPHSGNVKAVSFALSPTGNTVFLPYSRDEVHSIVLPTNPGGVTTVLTPNLDGCCVFVETRNNGELILYHANAVTGVSPTMLQSATQPTFQTPGCLNQLSTMYATARTDHAAGYVGSSTYVAFKKARYVREVDRVLQHKTAQGRTGTGGAGTAPEQASKTTVAVFWKNNRWEMWFQTYAIFFYKRPETHWKAKVGFSTINPSVTGNYKVLESGCYFP